jgi:VIT1/CCC1 family predicted Fe2+/Mn2+ transporter
LVRAVIAAGGVGVALASFTGRSRWFSAMRQVLIAAVAALATYGIGHLIGVQVS